LQEYLKQFNELFEELQSKKVGVMAVCAQPQDKVDEMEKKLNLKFKVSILFDG
jgi:peroxiredoxin